jgi:hypothetical protein
MKTDFLRAALQKKNTNNTASHKQGQTDTGGKTPKNQVATNKPARKSAGRGR